MRCDPRTMTDNQPRRTRGGPTIVRDEGGQVASWLIKLLLIVAVVGFLVIEFGAVVVNRLQVQDVADQTAAEAGIVYVDRRSQDAAVERAEEFAQDNGAEFVELTVDERQRVIRVTVTKQASTRVLHRIDLFEGLVDARAEGQAPLRT